MKKNQLTKELLLFCFCMLLIPISSFADELICVHGNSGNIQDPTHYKASAYQVKGWGVEYEVAGTGTWLHYSIPVPSYKRVKTIVILMENPKPSVGWIRDVGIYDGRDIVGKFFGKFYGKNGDKLQRHKIDIHPRVFTRGLGISLLPETHRSGKLSDLVRFKFNSVCAIVED